MHVLGRRFEYWGTAKIVYAQHFLSSYDLKNDVLHDMGKFKVLVLPPSTRIWG